MRDLLATEEPKDLFAPAPNTTTETEPKDLLSTEGPTDLLSDNANKGFFESAGDLALKGVTAIGETTDYVINNPKESFNKVKDFGASVAESTPKVLGGAAQRVATGTVQLIPDLMSLQDRMDAKAFSQDPKLAEKAKVAEERLKQSTDLSKSIEDKAKEISPDYINKLTPGEATAADLTAVVGSGLTGGALGASKAATMFPSLSKSFPSIAKILATGTGAAAAEAVTTGSQVQLDPLLLGNENTDRTVKNRVLSPLEGFGIGTAVEGAIKGVRSIPEIRAKVADLLERKPIREVAQEEPQAVEEILTSKFEADGLSTEEAQIQAQNALKGASGAGDVPPIINDSIDPELGVFARKHAQIYDKLTPIRNIEKQAYGIEGKYREDTPITVAIQNAIQREPKITELIATQGVPKASDGGLDLIKKSDIGKGGDEPVGGLKQIVDRIQEAGGDPEEAMKYMQYKRIRKDYSIAEGDELAKHTAVNDAKNSLVDAQEALRAVKPDDVADYKAKLESYNEAKNAVRQAEAIAPRRTSIGLPIQEVDKYLASVEAKPWAKVAEEEFSSFFKATRTWLKESGNLDDVQLKNLDNFYGDDYFPAYRQPKLIDNTSKTFGSSTSRGKGVDAAKGGQDDYMSPQESLINYVAKVSSSAQRNAVLNKTVDLFEELPDATWNKIFNTPRDDYIKQVLGAAEAKESGLLSETLEDLADDVVTKEGNMTFYRNGRKISLSVKDKDIAQTLASLSPPSNGGPLTEAFKVLSDLQRNIITLAVPFTAANAFRDGMTAAITSRTGSKPFLVSAQGALRMRKDPQLYEQYLRDTGGGISWANLGKAKSEREVQEAISKLKGEYKANRWLGVPFKEAYKTLEEFSNRVENLPRFEEYARTLEQGGSRGLATSRAGEVTVNFAVRGSSQGVNQLNQVGMFLNASLQGMDRSVRLLAKDPSRTGELAFKYITIPALALYSYNSQFPNYYDIPKTVRHTNWIIMYGDGPDEYIKIPRDREISPLFAGLPEAMFDDLYKSTGGAEVANQAIAAIKPLAGIPNAIPPHVQLMIDLHANKSSFTGAPIEPQRFEYGTPPEERYTEKTSPTYRALGQALGVSPIKLEYAGNMLLNWWGDIIEGAINDPIVKKVMDIPEGPTKRLADYPGLNRFFGNTTQDSTASVYSIAAGMQDDVDRMNKYQSVLRGSTSDEGQIKRAEKFFDENPGKVEFLGYLQDTVKAMSEIGKESNSYVADPQMSPEEKRKQIDQLNLERDRVAKDFLNDIQSNPDFKKYYGEQYTGTAGVVPWVSQYLVKVKPVTEKPDQSFTDRVSDQFKRMTAKKAPKAVEEEGNK